MRAFGICIALIGAPAFAAELAFSTEATEQCLAGAATEKAQVECIGASAEACYSPDDVYSNYAFGTCLSKEADYWDRRLRASYHALLEAEIALTKEIEEIGAHVPDAEAALREMWRAWLPYRDAACWYEYSTWGNGTGGGPANAGCLMELSGRMALSFEARLKERGE